MSNHESLQPKNGEEQGREKPLTIEQFNDWGVRASINNIKVRVLWETGFTGYVISFPEIDPSRNDSLYISRDEKDAKTVYEFVKKEAMNVKTTEELQESVVKFLSNLETTPN